MLFSRHLMSIWVQEIDFLKKIEHAIWQLLGSGIEALPRCLIAIAFLIFTSWAARFVRDTSTRIFAATVKRQSLQQLFVQFNHAATWAVGALVVGAILFPDLDLSHLLGLLGVSSVAFSLAFQDISKNFLAGVLLLLHEPFSIGDEITLEDYDGIVEEISIRSTKIRTYQGHLVLVPNAIVFTSIIQVSTDLPNLRTDLEMRIDYTTPLSDAIEVLDRAVSTVEGVLSEPPPEVDFVNFGESSVDLHVRYWTESQDIQVRRVKTQVILALKKACDTAGIVIPYPIQTIYYQEKNIAKF